MKLSWPICGPKLSLCCTVISVWGIIQFLLLGVFFYVQSVPLLEDFDFDHDTPDNNIFADRLREAYHQRAYNCWIAAFLYVALLVFAGVQCMTNLRRSRTSHYQAPVTSPFAGVSTEQARRSQWWIIENFLFSFVCLRSYWFTFIERKNS